jgi:hypothetical protein
MESPKRKLISYRKSGVLEVDQVEPSVAEGSSVWLNFSEGKRIK